MDKTPKTLDEALDRIAELEELVMTDELTGLCNRRGLDLVMDKARARQQRNRDQLSVIAIDIDHFKQFNDTHGHDMGDQVLRRVAVAIQDTIRTRDTAFRQGGEEMMVVAESTDANGVLTLAEKLRREIEEIALWSDEGHAVTVTASFGVATRCPEGGNLLKRADKALYVAKEAGRNRVEVG